jgi:hypothetical protein
MSRCPTSRKCTQRIHPTRFAPSILLKLSSTNRHLLGSLTPACCIACHVRFVRLSVMMGGGERAANLQVKCWLWLTRDVFFTVITEHNAFYLIAQTQDLQDTFCMLPSTSSQTSDRSLCLLSAPSGRHSLRPIHDILNGLCPAIAVAQAD